MYPTVGTSEEYSFRRYIIEANKTKVYLFVIEWRTEFQPDYDTEMNLIKQDISYIYYEIESNEGHYHFLFHL